MLNNIEVTSETTKLQMLNNIDFVLAKATKPAEVIKDGPILYLVLNNGGDFTFDAVSITQVINCLDEIEATEGAAVLVTISTSQKRFSTGFSLPYWYAHKTHPFKCISMMQVLLERLLKLSMPSLCVIKGHCYAGGLILALCHDFRVMKAGSGRLCLSEINVGLALPPAYAMMVGTLMPKQIAREMLMGRAIGTPEAMDRKVVT